MSTRSWAVSSRLLAGLAIAGLTGAVIHVVAAGSPSWTSLGLLLLALGSTSLAMAQDGMWLWVTRPGILAFAAMIPAFASVVVVVLLIERDTDDRTVLQLWLLSIALYLVTAWRMPIMSAIDRGGARKPRWPRGSALAALCGMLAIAFVPRLVFLDRFPAMLDGDEGSFMVLARQAQHGELVGLFRPGFWGSPNLYPAVSGWLASLAGSPPADYRILGGLVGALGVLATWRLGRYLGDAWGAVAGAVVLATMPFHLHFSRNALNNVTDATVLASSLFLLLRAVRFRRGGDAALAGVVLGLGLYGYFGARVFPVILLVSLTILAAGRAVPSLTALRLGSWMVGGVIVAVIPLAMEFRANPAEFAGRLDQVSPISRSSLAADPGAMLRLYIDNLRDAVLYPFVSINQGFFRRSDPWVGWPVALLMPIGVAGFVSQVVRHRNVPALACLLAPWAMVLAGVALTFPIQSQRMVALAPLFALAAGFGLVRVARWLEAAVRPTVVPLAGLIVVTVLVVVGIGEIRWFASNDRQVSSYGDYRSMMMWDIGWRSSRDGPSAGATPAVLFAGPPFVFAGGFNNLAIQAPDLQMHDVPESLEALELPLTLPQDTVLILIRERATERCAAEWSNPEATVAEAHARDGTLLYVALYREPLPGWSTDESPAGTIFEPVTDSPCA